MALPSMNSAKESPRCALVSCRPWNGMGSAALGVDVPLSGIDPGFTYSLTINFAALDRYIFRRNQSSIAAFNWSNGTFLPISITPSAIGSVSSKTLALVKFRMEKLSSHFSGQARRWPSSSYSTRILRANIHDDLTTDAEE